LKSIKLVACDMDGTLLDNNKKIPPANIEAVRKLKEAEIYFVIATGRHDSMVKWYLDDLHIEMPVISCNGALVREPFSGRTFSTSPFSKKHALDILEICRRAGADYHIYCRDSIFGETETNKIKYYTELNRNLPERDRVNLIVDPDYRGFIEGTEEELYKILILSEDLTVLTAIEDMIFERTCIRSSRSDHYLLDVMPHGISKATALKALCGELNISRDETAAIGDQLNDMEMLEFAGTAVAVANAVAEVRDASDIITAKTNVEGGAAEAIDRILSLA
jgi:Cof subfamily protein (haloacid dehalogenase superfamily)